MTQTLFSQTDVGAEMRVSTYFIPCRRAPIAGVTTVFFCTSTKYLKSVVLNLLVPQARCMVWDPFVDWVSPRGLALPPSIPSGIGPWSLVLPPPRPVLWNQALDPVCRSWGSLQVQRFSNRVVVPLLFHYQISGPLGSPVGQMTQCCGPALVHRPEVEHACHSSLISPKSSLILKLPAMLPLVDKVAWRTMVLCSPPCTPFFLSLTLLPVPCCSLAPSCQRNLAVLGVTPRWFA